MSQRVNFILIFSAGLIYYFTFPRGTFADFFVYVLNYIHDMQIDKLHEPRNPYFQNITIVIVVYQM